MIPFEASTALVPFKASHVRERPIYLCCSEELPHGGTSEIICVHCDGGSGFTNFDVVKEMLKFETKQAQPNQKKNLKTESSSQQKILEYKCQSC